MIAVDALPGTLDDEAAQVLTDALIDDPGWVAVGPRDRERRSRFMRRFMDGTLRIARRWGGPIWAAFDEGELAGCAVTLGEGRYPPPQSSLRYVAGATLLAGPGTLVRGLRSQALFDRLHFHDPHVWLWMLGVAPERQRRGAGRALVERTARHSEHDGVPVFLETAKAANVPYYASLGFEVIDEATLPGGGPIWFMLREPRA